MTSDFSHQDWRDRSFRGQDLRQLSFEGADVRGCDFRDAQLNGTTFKNAKLGRTRQQIVVVAITVTSLTILAFHAFSHMFFGGLGTTSTDPAWAYVLALQINLALAGGMTALQGPLQQARKNAQPQTQPQEQQATPASLQAWLHQSWLQRGAAILSMMTSCALLGFFYGGSFSGNDPKVASVTSIIMAIIGAAIGNGIGPRWLTAGLTMVGAIAAYGFFLTAGTNASALLHGQKYALGLFWLGVSALYLKWTIDSLTFANRRINAAMSTCFDPF